MKLKFHAGAVKRDRYDRQKRNPFSSFKLPAVSLALLSAFAFVPMLFPKPVAAQGVAPRAATQAPDSTKPASGPAADTAKPAATAASDSVRPTLQWADKGPLPLPAAAKDTTILGATPAAAEDTAPTSASAIGDVPKPDVRAVVLRPFISVGSMLAHEPSVITGINSVPLGVRDVPVHPDDLRFGEGTSWAKPIGNLGGDFHVQSGGILEILAGLDLSFHNGLAAIVFGAGYTLRHCGDSTVFNERNYATRSIVNGLFLPDTGSPTGYKKDYGYAYASLTYYNIMYDASSFCFFTEAKVAASRRLSFGLGCKVYWENVSASNGWDKEGGYFERGGTLTEWKSFDIASLAVKMPYAFADFQLTPPDADPFIRAALRAYFGAKYASFSYLMPSTELVLRKTPVYAVGLKLDFEAIKKL